jgi:hypothetical protein
MVVCLSNFCGGEREEMRLGILAFRLLAALPLLICGVAHAEVASVYGGRDGLCGHRTANGERLNCAEMTAAHRTLPFGTRIVVCHNGCVILASTIAALGFEAGNLICHQLRREPSV